MSETGSFPVQSGYGRARGRPYRRYVEIAVLGVAIALIWTVLTLPTVFYHLPVKEDSTNSSSIGPIPISHECSSDVYTGSICRSALQSLQNCIPNRCGSTEVYILSNTSQSELESHVRRLLGGLELLNPSSECREAVGPFLCSYYFGLCSSDNQPYLPSSGQCEKIATETCATEFEQAISLLGRDGLPQCETLSAVPTVELDCTGLGECPGASETPTVTPETTGPSTSPTDSNISASPNGTCSPEVYTGQVCRSALQSLQNCIPDRCGSCEVYIPSNGKQTEIEQQVMSLLTGLQLLNQSEDCQAANVPFLCSYSFGLCDSSNKLHLPSFEDCGQISNQTCATEFQTAISLLGRENLPQCDTLPTTSPTSLQLECSGQCHASSTEMVFKESSNEQCNAEVYVGTVCRAALQSLQNCIPGRCDSTKVYIPFTGNQSNIEGQLMRLLDGLQLVNPSPECQAAVVPFLCSYYFRLCDKSKLYLPSSSECENVASETCADEFQRATELVGRENLPHCDILPQISTIGLNCNAEGTTASPTVNNNDIDGISSDRNISCRKGFYLEPRNGSGGACIPECGKWEEFPHYVVVAGDVIAILQAVVYIIAAAVLLVMACIHHKRMFKFPAIFVVYEMFPLGLFEVFILIGFMDRTTLYCSSNSLIESLRSPTDFCKYIQGGVSHFVFLQQLLLWFFHIVAVFWTIKFPFHAKSFENKGYTSFVHFGMLALTFILPSVFVAVVFGTGGCRGARIPAIICLAREPDVTFYAFVLPLSIVTAAGISLIVFMFWILYHITRDLSHIQKKKEEEKGEKVITKRRLTSLKHHATLNAAEMKILIIFIYFSVFLGSILITFTIRLHGFENLISGIRKYFTCESFGIQDEDCMRSFERIESEVSAIITYALIGFYPLVSLIYVVNLQELRQMYPWMFKHIGRREMTSTSGTFKPRGTITSTGL